MDEREMEDLPIPRGWWKDYKGGSHSRKEAKEWELHHFCYDKMVWVTKIMKIPSPPRLGKFHTVLCLLIDCYITFDTVLSNTRKAQTWVCECPCSSWGCHTAVWAAVCLPSTQEWFPWPCTRPCTCQCEYLIMYSTENIEFTILQPRILHTTQTTLLHTPKIQKQYRMKSP